MLFPFLCQMVRNGAFFFWYECACWISPPVLPQLTKIFEFSVYVKVEWALRIHIPYRICSFSIFHLVIVVS